MVVAGGARAFLRSQDISSQSTQQEGKHFLVPGMPKTFSPHGSGGWGRASTIESDLAWVLLAPQRLLKTVFTQAQGQIDKEIFKASKQINRCII